MAAAYTTVGWLSQRRQDHGGDLVDDDSNRSPALPENDDALAAVFARLSDAADVVRCAATCRRWCRVIAKEAAVLARVVPSELTRSGRAVLGLFHQEDAGPRKRKRGAGQQPCLVPTAAGARLVRSPSPWSTGDGGLLEYSRPVASRNGRVVLELRRERHAEGLRLCVLNPVTGDTALLPPLSGSDRPGSYACALLTTSDDDTLKRPPFFFFFRVLVVYNRRSFTAFRAYSSDTGRWSAEAARSDGPKIDEPRLRRLGQGVVLRGVAYWPLRRSALAVRLDAEPREVAMSPDGIPGADDAQRSRLMGVTTQDPDGKKQQLCFIEAGFRSDTSLRKAGLPFRSIVLITIVLVHRNLYAPGESWCRRRWEVTRGGGVLVPGLKVRSYDAVNLRWFCERTGVVLFTVGEDSSSPGTYAMNMKTQQLEKLADGAACDSWRNLVGYEMDASAFLASVACY